MSGPAKGQAIEVRVQDSAGSTVYATSVRGEDGRQRPQLDVRVPPQGTDTCPDPISGIYVLVVKNWTRERINVWLGDDNLGIVEGVGEQSFGPLPGTWPEAGGFEIRSSAGKNRLGEDFLMTDSWDYDLGQVPQIRVDITEF